MERRLLYAISLMVVGAVLPSLFMKPAPRRPVERGGAPAAAAPESTLGALPPPAPPTAGRTRPVEAELAATRATPISGDTATLVSPTSQYRFSGIGAVLDA